MSFAGSGGTRSFRPVWGRLPGGEIVFRENKWVQFGGFVDLGGAGVLIGGETKLAGDLGEGVGEGLPDFGLGAAAGQVLGAVEAGEASGAAIETMRRMKNRNWGRE